MATGVTIQGLPERAPLHRRILHEIAGVLAPFRPQPATLRVVFSDEDGPKGGPAIRCTLTVRAPRRAVLRVAHDATTPRLAFDGALAALERRLGRVREETRDLRRRPKKYFVAKRLLQPEVAEGAS